MEKFVPPAYNASAFTCPHCAVLAQQHRTDGLVRSGNGVTLLDELALHRCQSCAKWIVWWDTKMVVPVIAGFAPANPDLPPEIARDYAEAASIVAQSPRGAAALLRLCVQKLCAHLGYNQAKIDDAIAAMVKDGLPVKISQSLDVVRVIGNNAVHPGAMDLADDVNLVQQLAGLINLIAENRISEPKSIDELFAKLPAGAQTAIAARNTKAMPGPATI
jgi:hypothetical protein